MTKLSQLITLRPVREEDRDLLFRIYASTRTEELAIVPWSADQKAAFLRMQFEAQAEDYGRNYAGADFSIIEVDGVPAGRLYVERRSEEIRLIDIALLPAFRQAGLGTKLLKELIAESTARAIPLTIHVEIFNPARRLYERLGFAPVEEHGMYLLMRRLPDAAEVTVS